MVRFYGLPIEYWLRKKRHIFWGYYLKILIVSASERLDRMEEQHAADPGKVAQRLVMLRRGYEATEQIPQELLDRLRSSGIDTSPSRS